ncbi:hypothetical protein PAEPH01_2588 [Pancytospora epiphaga]|nr:hypothetical protein PAEPH01_2588 [Pancytospora epiphaga]
MKSKEGHGFYLMFIFILITTYHFLPILYGTYSQHRIIKRLKKTFNEILLQDSPDLERMKYLKILINNYTSHEDSKIFEYENDKLKNILKNIKIIHTKLWQIYTLKYQAIILGPTVIPVLLYIVKQLDYSFFNR